MLRTAEKYACFQPKYFYPPHFMRLFFKRVRLSGASESILCGLSIMVPNKNIICACLVCTEMLLLLNQPSRTVYCIFLPRFLL